MGLPLILASTSPYRRQLLERLAYPFQCQAPQVNETAYKSQTSSPEALAALLAREKAREVALRFPGQLVIGGDQVAALGAGILGKPGSVEAAIAQLTRLQGQTHQLYTAVHFIGPGIDRALMSITELTMRSLNFNEIRSYVMLDHPLDCAGSYKLESAGIKLFTQITGGDHDAIVGLPLMMVQNVLTELGFRLFE